MRLKDLTPPRENCLVLQSLVKLLWNKIRKEFLQQSQWCTRCISLHSILSDGCGFFLSHFNWLFFSKTSLQIHDVWFYVSIIASHLQPTNKRTGEYLWLPNDQAWHLFGVFFVHHRRRCHQFFCFCSPRTSSRIFTLDALTNFVAGSELLLCIIFQRYCRPDAWYASLVWY